MLCHQLRQRSINTSAQHRETLAAFEINVSTLLHYLSCFWCSSQRTIRILPDSFVIQLFLYIPQKIICPFFSWLPLEAVAQTCFSCLCNLQTGDGMLRDMSPFWYMHTLFLKRFRCCVWRHRESGRISGLDPKIAAFFPLCFRKHQKGPEPPALQSSILFPLSFLTQFPSLPSPLFGISLFFLLHPFPPRLSLALILYSFLSPKVHLSQGLYDSFAFLPVSSLLSPPHSPL